MKKIFLQLIVLLLFFGCTSVVTSDKEQVATASVNDVVQSKVVKIIDREHGAVCWIYPPSGGISCLPNGVLKTH